MQKRAESPAVVDCLRYWEIWGAKIVNRGNKWYAVPKRIFERSECFASYLPGLANKVRFGEVCLVNIDDSLAGHKFIDETQCKLLALIAAAYDIGSSGNMLGSLEYEAKLIQHHMTHKLTAYSARMVVLGKSVNLFNADNEPISLK